MNSQKDLSHSLRDLDNLPAIPSIAMEILSMNLITEEGEQAPEQEISHV
jgi:hypothetical protein